MKKHCMQSGQNSKDVLALERVRRDFNRMLLEMGHFRYEERLEKLGLFSLEHRRLRGT